MTFIGHFLVFFNRHSDEPRVWCVAHPDRAWEINVPSIEFRGVYLSTKYLGKQLYSPLHDGPPSAVFEGFGKVVVGPDGIAIITPV